jgi:sugar phosphate isomerase/epimerase
MTHPLGLGHFTFLDLAPPELIRLAGETGFAFVGLRLVPAMPGGLSYDLPPGSHALAETKAAMAGEGVSVYDIEAVVIDEGFRPEALRPALEQAAELGANRLNIAADDADESRLQGKFDALCDLAADHGIGVDVECIAWRSVNTFGRCATLVARSDRADAGILIDTLHLYRCGGNAAGVAALPPGAVRSAQLCDAPVEAPKTTEARIAEARGGRLPPGEGGLDLAAVVRALPRCTVFSVELPVASDEPPGPRARRIFTATQALLARALEGPPA